MKKTNEKVIYKTIIIAIIVIGIILRILYISYTDIYERQHDVTGKKEHLEYIQTIYETGELPKDNQWQFYQQPLHHIISGTWLRINDFLGIEQNKAEEGLQILTTIYSSMLMFITYWILKELKIKDIYKILVIMIIAVHPTFIILSGSINNDILMIMLTFFAILFLIKWHKKPNYKNTIILALCTALIALTKISGTIIAIPIIYVFLKRFIRDYSKAENKKKILIGYILKFVLFGVIALGLGLSYSIRNLILFGQSIFYVPVPGQIIYCGDKGLLERVNIFSHEILETYCYAFTDCNIPSYIIKCSLFGEYKPINIIENQLISRALIVFNCILIAISIISLINIVFNYKKINKRFRVYLNIFILLYISQMFMYLYANISMPYGCTMDFRYIVPTILTGMMFIVINMMRFNKNKKNLIKTRITYILVVAFVLLSIIYEVSYMKLLR